MRKLPLLLAFSVGVAQAQVVNIDSLQQILRNNKQDIEESIALTTLATECTRTDMTKARNYLYSAIDISRKLKDDRTLSYAYSTMFTIQQNSGKTDSALCYLQYIKKLSDESDIPEVKGNFNMMAGLFYKRQGDYKRALPYMIASLKDIVEANKRNPSNSRKAGIAGQYLNIGNTYDNLGIFKNALSYHLMALRMFEKMNNSKGLSFCYQSIATDFMNLNQLGSALDYTRRSIALKDALNDKRGLATSSVILAEIYQRQGQYDQSLKSFSTSLKTFQEMHLMIDEAQTDIHIGKLYSLKKEPSTAAVFFQHAKDLALSLKDSSLLTTINAESVALEMDEKKQQETESKLMNSLQMSIRRGDKSSELQNDEYLSDYYTRSRQFEKALIYTNKVHQITDSLQSRDLGLQMNRMEKQYSLDKKEREIELLKKDRLLDQANLQKQKNIQTFGVLFLAFLLVTGVLITNRNRALNKARRIIEMEKMRNNIARDLHDDIGSMLTSINILSTMTMQQLNGEPGVTSNLQKIKNRSATMMESMSDIIWAINPANDTVEKMIRRMREFTAAMLDPLEVDHTFTEMHNLASIALDAKQRKDIYLFFKEAVHNAAKHSGCTRFRMTIRKDHQSLQLEIAENGKGFNPDTVKSGNGLANMKARARSLHGDIQIKTGEGQGTTIIFTIPLTS